MQTPALGRLQWSGLFFSVGDDQTNRGSVGGVPSSRLDVSPGRRPGLGVGRVASDWNFVAGVLSGRSSRQFNAVKRQAAIRLRVSPSRGQKRLARVVSRCESGFSRSGTRLSTIAASLGRPARAGEPSPNYSCLPQSTSRWSAEMHPRGRETHRPSRRPEPRTVVRRSRWRTSATAYASKSAARQ